LSEKLELRGCKEICDALGCKDWRTAKRRLQALRVLQYDKKTPVLVVAKYQAAVEGLR
jgi:hypothetical protein